VPLVRSVTTSPATVQTAVLVDVTATGSPDDAVGETTTGDAANFCLPGETNVIDWFAFDTVNERVAVGAGL